MPDAEEPRRLLEGQVAIVTGAAKGIGRGIAIEMAREGASIVLADVDEEGMAETVRQVTELGRTSVSIPTDVQDLEHCQRLVDQAFQHFGRIDILVSNAGVNTPGFARFMDVSPEMYDAVLQTNLRGAFFLAQCMARALIERQIQGTILFTSSTHARVISMQPAYSASKAGLEMLIREMALELAEYGIRVNAVAPGWIEVRDHDDRTNPMIPLGYTGDPEDVAHAMVFLASRYASYITGQVLTVDGGFSITHTHYWFKKRMFYR